MDPHADDEPPPPYLISSSETNIMEGSKIDTSTAAGRQLKEDIECAQESGALLLSDTSDRLYLREQLRLKRKQEEKHQHDKKVALESFREEAVSKLGKEISIARPHKAKSRIGFDTKPPPIKVKKKTKLKGKGTAQVQKVKKRINVVAMNQPQLLGDTYASSSEDNP